MTLVYLTAAWLAGIAVSKASGAPWLLWAGLALPALAGIALARARPAWRTGFACALLFALGAARYAISVPHIGPGDLAAYNDQGFVTVEGMIVDAPDVRDTHINLRVRVQTLIAANGAAQPVSGLLLAQTPRVGTFRYGDPVRLTGDLRTPPVFDTFSYRDYLARQGVYSTMQFTQVEVTGPRQGSPIRAAMLDFRQQAYTLIQRLLPDPQASLLQGILLGIETGISPDVSDAFSTVSATHIIAISGTNLVILAGLIQALAQRIVKRRGWVAGITITGIFVYSIFVGGDPAVIRAAIMTTLALVALELGRQTYGLASLSFAALAMTAIDPTVLWDVGFQLSFLATLGLVLYVEPLQKLLASVLERLTSQERAQAIVGAVSDAFVVTVAAQITTTPIMAYTFRRFSLVSLPVNFLIIPAQTPLMVFGGLGVLAAPVFWPLGQALAWASWVFLTWTIGVVQVAARLPMASIAVQNVSPGVIWGIYVAMFGITLYAIQPPETRAEQRHWLRQAFGVKSLGFAGLIATALLWAGVWSLPDGRLHVTFFDVGDGSSTLITTPSGRHVLVDAGGSGRSLSAGMGRALPFWQRRVDLLVITQTDATHTAALPAIVDRYRFDSVMTNGQPPADATAQAALSALDAHGTVAVLGQPGMRVSVGDGVTLMVVGAPVGPPDESQASPPVSVMVSYGETRVLLPGDLAPEDETALMDGPYPLDASALLVPRSGNRSVSSDAFLATVSPQIAVISVDAGNRFGLPHAEVLERLAAAGATMYRTDQSGTVRIIADGARMWVKTDR